MLLVADQLGLVPGAGPGQVDRREDLLLREVAVQPQHQALGAGQLLDEQLVDGRAALHQTRWRGWSASRRPRGCGRPRRTAWSRSAPTASTPPASVRPLVGAATLYARPSRVRPSTSTTTSWPSSTSRLARSTASSATVVWSAGGAVERRGDDLALDRALEVGDLLGPLVDQDHHQVALGVVGRDRVGDRLQDRGLAGLGRRHDQAALALADRGRDVDHPADRGCPGRSRAGAAARGGSASAWRSRRGSWPLRGRCR